MNRRRQVRERKLKNKTKRMYSMRVLIKRINKIIDDTFGARSK